MRAIVACYRSSSFHRQTIHCQVIAVSLPLPVFIADAITIYPKQVASRLRCVGKTTGAVDVFMMTRGIGTMTEAVEDGYADGYGLFP